MADTAHAHTMLTRGVVGAHATATNSDTPEKCLHIPIANWWAATQLLIIFTYQLCYYSICYLYQVNATIYEPLQRHGYTWKWRLTHRPFWAPFCDSSRSSFFLPFCCSSSTLPLGWPLSAIWPLPGLHPLLWRCRPQEYQEVGLTVSVKIEENAIRLSEEPVPLSGHLWPHTRMT